MTLPGYTAEASLQEENNQHQLATKRYGVHAELVHPSLFYIPRVPISWGPQVNWVCYDTCIENNWMQCARDPQGCQVSCLNQCTGNAWFPLPQLV